MKDLRHHDGLALREIRDLVANAHSPSPCADLHLRGEKRDPMRVFLVEQLEKAREQLSQFDLTTGLRLVMDQHDWEPWDCSDEVKSYSPKTYAPFVGTRDEFLAAYPDAKP